MTTTRQMTEAELGELIAEEFGVNADYVSELLLQYTRNPHSVDEEWRGYFAELLSNGQLPTDHAGNGSAAQPAQAQTPPAPASSSVLHAEYNWGAQPASTPTTQATPAPPAAAPALPTAQATTAAQPTAVGDRLAIRGPALRLAENMEASLAVPNLKGADKMSFRQLLDAYDDVVKRARGSKLQIEDFQGTTISLTNPGTIGTTASNPRLMRGQGVIIATGAIEYPPEYQAMSHESLSRIGISKIITLT